MPSVAVDYDNDRVCATVAAPVWGRARRMKTVNDRFAFINNVKKVKLFSYFISKPELVHPFNIFI